MGNVPISEDGFYQCCCCNVWWKFKPSNVAAISDDGVYCPDCANELSIIELDMYTKFIHMHQDLPTQSQLACIKRIVWQVLASPLNRNEAHF